MDDIASKLSELLNSPGSMEQIKNLAGLLGGGETPAQSEPKQEQKSPLAGLDGDMMQMIVKFAPLLSSFRQEDDYTRLLHALRPLLGEARKKKLDEAIRLLQLIRLLPLLKGSGIL